ncbi:MAG TPA: hypothetical protein PLB21_13065 [Actinomycetota bacterium]|nr:hypothetical protein [Actinomycetota bacterium]
MKVGKGPAHAVLETNWNAAYVRAKLENGWLGMTSMSGPSEAWYLMGFGSWGEMEKYNRAAEANEAWSAENAKFLTQDGDLLSRASYIIASYRPAMSYRAASNMATKRYMQIQVVRVKPGRTREFFDNWRELVLAHEKAKMEESWAFYQVVTGMPDGTFIYMQPHASLADVDRAGQIHGTDAYRNAVGEAGRARTREMHQLAIESSQTLYFAFNPTMSTVPKAWGDADPFWAPKPPPPAKPAEKKK